MEAMSRDERWNEIGRGYAARSLTYRDARAMLLEIDPTPAFVEECLSIIDGGGDCIELPNPIAVP